RSPDMPGKPDQPGLLKQGLAGSIAQILSAPSEPSVRQPILDALALLMTHAQADGALRDDVTVHDVLLILKENAGVIANSPRTGGGSAATVRRTGAA
ncbi:SbtR family transcriptional regulator, partial [Streptomonospora salina]